MGKRIFTHDFNKKFEGIIEIVPNKSRTRIQWQVVSQISNYRHVYTTQSPTFYRVVAARRPAFDCEGQTLYVRGEVRSRNLEIVTMFSERGSRGNHLSKVIKSFTLAGFDVVLL